MYPDVTHSHEHNNTSGAGTTSLAFFGIGWLREAQLTHVVCPLAVGDVEYPLSQSSQVSEEVACKAVEYFPGSQDEHEDDMPSLNLPIGHGVHALSHVTHVRSVEPILHVVLELQLTQTLDPATDPEPSGHAWQAVAP